MGQQKITDLTPGEQDWIARNLAKAGEVAERYGLGPDAESRLGPATLDRAWAAWLAEHQRGADDPNSIINAFGIALGQHFVDRLGLEWKVVQDDQGTEMAVWGRAGDVLVFPPNLVGKRYASGVTTFFEEVATQTEATVTEVRAKLAAPQRSVLGRLFGRDR